MDVRKDRSLASVITCLCIVFFILTWNFPRGASYYPRGIIILILIVCVPLFVKASPKNTTALGAVFRHFFIDRRLLYVLVALGALIVLMEPLGLYIELPFFTAFIMYVMEYRKRLYLFLIPLGLTAVIFVVFSMILKVQVPVGLLKF